MNVLLFEAETIKKMNYNIIILFIIKETLHINTLMLFLIFVHESNKTIESPNIAKEVRNCVSNKLI